MVVLQKLVKFQISHKLESLKLYLTPTLDAEFFMYKTSKIYARYCSNSKGVPTPALITRAVHELASFNNIEILNLGMSVEPKIDYFKIHNFDIKREPKYSNRCKYQCYGSFPKGLEFGQTYKTNDDYVILAETIPAGLQQQMQQDWDYLMIVRDIFQVHTKQSK